MKNAQVTVIVILVAAVALMVGYSLNNSDDYDSGYKDGKAYVCNSPQVPFRTVNLPACR